MDFMAKTNSDRNTQRAGLTAQRDKFILAKEERDNGDVEAAKALLDVYLGFAKQYLEWEKGARDAAPENLQNSAKAGWNERIMLYIDFITIFQVDCRGEWKDSASWDFEKANSILDQIIGEE